MPFLILFLLFLYFFYWSTCYFITHQLVILSFGWSIHQPILNKWIDYQQVNLPHPVLSELELDALLVCLTIYNLKFNFKYVIILNIHKNSFKRYLWIFTKKKIILVTHFKASFYLILNAHKLKNLVTIN